MANFVKTENAPKSIIMSSASKSFSQFTLKPILSLNTWKAGKETGGEVALFLIKIIALETVRRLSKAKCPFVWTGLQALQVLCYPPLKWIQRWNPFGVVIKVMQSLSRPLLVLSIVNAFSDPSDCNSFALDDTDNSRRDSNSQLGSESHSESPSLQRIGDGNHQAAQPMDWMHQLSEELENMGITLPERFNKVELQRFYVAANGDLSHLSSSVMKTIRWRETYRILSVEELETWSRLIFWHGLDVKGRPCLIIRLGMVCTGLPPQDRPSFVQAVVSQVEHGVVHLVNREDPQITVLVDCLGLSPLRFPMQMLKYCSNLLQDHFPNALGCLIIIRLPPVVRVIAQTFIEVLKPVTKQKLRIEGQMYKKVLNECFKTLPSYLGGPCTYTRCVKFDKGHMVDVRVNGYVATTESAADFSDTEDFPVEQPTHLDQYDMMMDNSCSRTLRTAVIGILIIWILIAFIEGIYNPESRPVLPI